MCRIQKDRYNYDATAIICDVTHITAINKYATNDHTARHSYVTKVAAHGNSL